MPYSNEELFYSLSQWVVRMPPEQVVDNHIQMVTAESDKVRQTIPNTRDIQYGTGEQERLDLYGIDLPEDSPVFVYIHGGYWQDLSKDISAYPATPLWRAGVRTVVAGYSLAPAANLDAIVKEIKRMAKFVLDKAVKDNCRSLWIGGHSAGAHLSASLLDPDWYNALEPELQRIFRGVVLISGIFDLTPLVHTYINKPLKLTREDALRLSPMYKEGMLLGDESIQVLVVVGQYDSPSIHGQSKAYTEWLKRKQIQTKLVDILENDHFSLVENLKEPSYTLTQEIISWIQKGN